MMKADLRIDTLGKNVRNLISGKKRMFNSKKYDKYYNNPKCDKHTNERLKLMDPKVSNDMRAMINESYDKYGIRLRIGKEVLRNMEEQKKLWLKGRDPKTEKVIDKKAVKTNSPPGASMHHYGWACDIYEINKKGKVIPFNRNKILPLSQKYGFRWGGHFSTIYDPAHFERTYGLKSRDILKKSQNQKIRYVNPLK